jgi:hypothetical protein
MDDKHAEQVIRLLEEIRDDQRLQLERQAVALERQAAGLAEQRQRLATIAQGTGAAEKIENQSQLVLAKSASVVGGARAVLILAFLILLPLLAFLLWNFVAHRTA